MRVIRSYTSVTTGTQRAISACLHNNILFRRLCAFYVQSFFCGKANLKNINQERSRKIPPCNHVFVIVLDSLGAAFGAAINHVLTDLEQHQPGKAPGPQIAL